mgnify:CR=1 FL=1
MEVVVESMVYNPPLYIVYFPIILIGWCCKSVNIQCNGKYLIKNDINKILYVNGSTDRKNMNIVCVCVCLCVFVCLYVGPLQYLCQMYDNTSTVNLHSNKGKHLETEHLLQNNI